MAKKLTRKQEVFVTSIIEQGVGSVAAREAYDIDPDNKPLASAIATENLAKPSIQKALTERLSLELVEEAHGSLLTAVRLDYFVFPKSMNDEEITLHVEAQGLTVLNIRPSEKGKLAFFSLPDGAARGKGIELWHKIKGSFAPEKSVNIHVEVESNPSVLEAARIINEHNRHINSGASDGVVSVPVGDEAPNQE